MTIGDLRRLLEHVPAELDGIELLCEEECGYNYYSFDRITLTTEPSVRKGDRVFVVGWVPSDYAEATYGPAGMVPTAD